MPYLWNGPGTHEPNATDEEEQTYRLLVRKLKVAAGFTVPIFLIAMSDMITGNPLHLLMNRSSWNWLQLLLSLPVIFYATRMFFERAWQSLLSRHYNMFTLIGIGAGAA